jgi:hypothetical protein
MLFQGRLVVKNPYGLLPAVFYGRLPFRYVNFTLSIPYNHPCLTLHASIFLGLGYFALALFYTLLLCRYRSQAIPLQYGIFSILIAGFISCVIWFLALVDMNESGTPFMWPLPPMFVFSVVCDIGMRTFARLILLVVCLG